MSDYKLSGGAEENILALLVWHEQHAITIANSYDPAISTSKHYRRIAEAAVSFIGKFKHPPQQHIYDLLERDLKGGEEAKHYKWALEQIEQSRQTINAEYVMAELDKFVRIRVRQMACDDALLALAAGDEDRADELLWQGNTQLKSQGDIGTWLHDDKLSFLQDSKDNDFFSSGVAELDRMGITPQRGTMTCFIAPKKWGKSWWCVNIGKAGVQYGHTVLHLSLENSAKLTRRRYLQAFFGMTKRQLETPSIRVPRFTRTESGQFDSIEFESLNPLALVEANRSEIIRRVRTLKKRPRLLVKEWPTGSLTIGQLNRFLDLLWRQEHFKPDILIIDYPDLMSLRGEFIRTDTGKIFRDLRGIAVERDLALCCPTQGNRRSDDARVVTSGMVGEDFSKVGTADMVLCGCRTPEERERNLARILVDAARDEEDKFMVMISQSYATGQFCLDSVMMGKHVQTQLDRLTGAAVSGDAEEASADRHE